MVSPNTVNTPLPKPFPVDNRRKINQPLRNRLHTVLGGKSVKTSYAENEVCFIRLPGHVKLFRGRVAASFTDAGVTGTYYIIKLDNFTWPQFEIRDASLMSPDGNGILPAVETIFNPNLPTFKEQTG